MHPWDLPARKGTLLSQSTLKLLKLHTWWHYMQGFTAMCLARCATDIESKRRQMLLHFGQKPFQSPRVSLMLRLCRDNFIKNWNTWIETKKQFTHSKILQKEKQVNIHPPQGLKSPGGLPAYFPGPKSASAMMNHIKKFDDNESVQKQSIWIKFTLLVKLTASVTERCLKRLINGM